MPKKQKDGRYRTQVVVAHTADGEPIVRYPAARTKAGLAEAVARAKAQYGVDGPGDMADVLFSEYAKKWLDGKEGEVRPNTARGYKSLLDHRIVPIIGNKQVRAVAPSDIKVVMAKAKEKSGATRATMLYIMRAVFNQAQDDGITLRNPTRSVKRKLDSEQKRRALTVEETTALLAYAKNRTDDTAMLAMLLYYTGARFGEVMGLQHKHISVADGTIRFTQQLIKKEGCGGEVSPLLKTTNSYRTVPMPAPLRDFLAQRPGMPEAFLFQRGGQPYAYMYARKLWTPVREQIGADITPHYLRHNYATKLYKADVRVKEAAALMGETVKIMLSTYAHIEKELGIETKQRVIDVFSEDVAKTLPSNEEKAK